MKLASLQSLVAAIDEGSLHGAARRLGISQPALTKQVRELELEVEAPLLVRTTRGVVPTAQGQVLYEHAAKASRELGTALDQIRQLSGDMAGDLEIGAVPLAVMLLIPETLRTFGREFPNIRLKVSEELYIAQLKRLRKREVDVAVGGIPHGLSSGEFQVEALMDTTMVVVVRRGNRLAKARSLRQLAQVPWVYTDAGSDNGYAKILFAAHNLPAPPIGAVVNSTLALVAVISGGDCVGLMPAQAMEHPMAQQYLSVVPVAEEGLPLTLAAIVRSDSVVSPAVRHFIAHLHRAAHQVRKKVAA